MNQTSAAAMHQEPDAPFRVPPGLIDTTDEHALGLPQAENTETVTIFAPGEQDLKFNHGVVLMPFQVRL